MSIHTSKYIRLLSGEFVGLKYIKRHQYLLFGDFSYNVSNSEGKRKVQDSLLTSSIIFSSLVNMPRSGKKSTKSQVTAEIRHSHN